MKNVFFPVSVIAVVLMVIGWVINIVTTVTMAIAGAPLSTLFVLKVIGIFVFPLGSILGFFF